MTLFTINPAFSTRAAGGTATERMIAFTGLPPKGAIQDIQA